MLSVAREILFNISKQEVLINKALADMFKISPYYAEIILQDFEKRWIHCFGY